MTDNQSGKKLRAYSSLIGIAILLLNYLFNWDIWTPSNDVLFLLSLFVSMILFIVAIYHSIHPLKENKDFVPTLGMKLLAVFNAFIGILGILLILGMLFLLFSREEYTQGSFKDAMINDLNNIAAHAYQYRIRPKSMKGGEGSFEGYVLPTKMATNDWGIYEYHPTANWIKVQAVCISNPGNTISVIIGSDGRLSQWSYIGDFE